MPRRSGIGRRQLTPDIVFGSTVVTQFINMLMMGGKRTAAEKIFYGAMEIMQDSTGRNPLEVFTEALQNVMPRLEVRPRRVGGATYQIPMEVPAQRQVTLSLRWLIAASRARHEKTMVERLANELMDAASNDGVSVKRREDIQRMAAANKAYAHYRW